MVRAHTQPMLGSTGLLTCIHVPTIPCRGTALGFHRPLSSVSVPRNSPVKRKIILTLHPCLRDVFFPLKMQWEEGTGKEGQPLLGHQVPRPPRLPSHPPPARLLQNPMPRHLAIPKCPLPTQPAPHVSLPLCSVGPPLRGAVRVCAGAQLLHLLRPLTRGQPTRKLLSLGPDETAGH